MGKDLQAQLLANEQALMDLAVEGWRFSRLFLKALSKMDAGVSGRYVNQLRYFQKRIEESLERSGLRLVNVEGQIFDPGVAAAALNIGDYEAGDKLVIDQMVEPIIMGEDGLKCQGTVTVSKVTG